MQVAFGLFLDSIVCFLLKLRYMLSLSLVVSFNRLGFGIPPVPTADEIHDLSLQSVKNASELM